MQNNNNKNTKQGIEANLTLINLQLKATTLENKNKLKDSLEALANFIGTKNERTVRF